MLKTDLILSNSDLFPLISASTIEIVQVKDDKGYSHGIHFSSISESDKSTLKNKRCYAARVHNVVYGLRQQQR